MDPNAVVLDISSDEETGGDDEPSFVDYEWISELLKGEFGGRNDSDDVVVVGEMRAKQNLKTSSVLKSSILDDDDDDDCVILDDDPDMPVSIIDDAASRSDELLVIGEKGQIACRDYPHSRHLCAKFPFGTTPHETHCVQCHCYVCDSLAPCVYWGTGSSITDHCLATDKEETWKLERKNVKLKIIGSLPVPKFPHTSQSMNQEVPPPTHFNSLPRNPVSRPTVIRPCSSSTNFGVPNIISQRAGLVFPKNRLPSPLVSPKLLGARNSIIRRNRFQNAGNTGHKFAPPPSIYKRAVSVGSSISFNQSHNPLYDVNLAGAPQNSRTFTPLAIPTDKNLSQWQDSLSSVDLQPNLCGIFENSLPCHPAVNSQPASLPNDSQSIYRHGNQTRYPSDLRFSDIGISLGDDTSQRNQQSQAQTAQLQSAELIKDPSLVPDLIPQIPGSGSNPTSLYFDFEDWLLENQPFTGVSKAAPPSDPNILAPESAHIDAGLLYFDFETSLNGLTRT